MNCVVKIKSVTFLLLIIWMLLNLASVFHCKPIVVTTHESAQIIKPIEILEQPKVVDITLPLSLTTTEDLITWATYAVRLMASRINVTVSQMKNDSRLPPSFTSEMLPKMEALVGKVMKNLPKVKPPSSKSSRYQREENIKGSETVPREFELSPPVDKVDGTARSFNVYHKDPRYPYNPFAEVVVEPQYNPFTRYAPNNAAYEPSGTRVFPEHALYPGIGYLPLSNRRNPFSVTPTKNYSQGESYQQTSSTLPTTVSEPSYVDNIESKNDKLKQDGVSTTLRPLITVPFEAYITITRDTSVPPAQLSVSTVTPIPSTSLSVQSIPDSYSTLKNQKEYDYYSTTSRDPPDEFPPFFNAVNEKVNVVNSNSKVEVSFENPETSTMKNVRRKTNTKKENDKSKKKKKKQSNTLQQTLMKIVAPKQKNQTGNPKPLDELAPIIRIVSERNQKLRKQSERKKKTRVQNINIDDDVSDYDDEKLDEEDSDEDDDEDDADRVNETNSNSSQEEDDDDDDDEPKGSIQPLIDLLPLIAPVLEDLSDPNTKTDFVAIIQAAAPLIQGILEGDEDNPGIDIAGVIGPVLASISAGPDGEGSDVAAVLGPILSLVAPIIGPLVAPIIGPTLRLSSNPPDKGFSLGALINSVAGPLSQPTGPGGMSPFASVITQVVAGLSQELSRGNVGSDVGSLIGSVLMGVIAGTSAGLSGGSSGSGQTSYGTAPNYGPVGSSSSYGPHAVPAYTVNPLQIIGTSVKDILNAGVSVLTSLITAATGLLGASSGGSSSAPQPYYSPAPASYGGQTSSYNRPRKSVPAEGS